MCKNEQKPELCSWKEKAPEAEQFDFYDDSAGLAAFPVSTVANVRLQNQAALVLSIAPWGFRNCLKTSFLNHISEIWRITDCSTDRRAQQFMCIILAIRKCLDGGFSAEQNLVNNYIMVNNYIKPYKLALQTFLRMWGWKDLTVAVDRTSRDLADIQKRAVIRSLREHEKSYDSPVSWLSLPGRSVHQSYACLRLIACCFWTNQLIKKPNAPSYMLPELIFDRLWPTSCCGDIENRSSSSCNVLHAIVRLLP